MLKRALGFPSAAALVMGSMIGSGIFIVPAEIAREVNSPALVILVWLITGFMTLAAALSYGELAAMMPKAGGQYVFLRESLGPLFGFLFGWTLFLVIQTGTIAAVAVGFAKFLGVLFPVLSGNHWIAIGLVGLLTAVNIRGVKEGAVVQVTFTIAKVLAMGGLILIGFTLAKDASAMHVNFGHFWDGLRGPHFIRVGVGGPMAKVGLFTILAIAQVGSLFSADAWNNVTFAAAEVKNPQRNLPLALAIGTGGVILLYLLANFAYMAALPMDQIKTSAEDRVATAVLSHAFAGYGAKMMAVAILISTLGCANGLILAGARVFYAMSEDGLFFRAVQKIHPRYKTPVISLVVQGLWASILCLSGSYGQLLDYVIFAELVFYILTISGLFILRRKMPNAPRPYRALGYPWVPAVYIVMAAAIDLALLRYKPQYTWPGLLIVCSGIPVYFAWIHRDFLKRLCLIPYVK